MTKERIIRLICRLREKIEYIENGTADDSYYETVEKDINELLGIIQFLLISKPGFYYGYFLINATFEIDYQYDEAVKFEVENFRLVFKINPCLFCKYKFKEMVYLVCHEIDHIVYGHIFERIELEQNGADKDTLFKFDMAADTEINENLDAKAEECENSWLQPPKERMNLEKIEKIFDVSEELKYMPSDEYFELICNSDLKNSDEAEKELKKYVELQKRNMDNRSEEIIRAAVQNFLKDGINKMNDRQRGLLPDSVFSMINSNERKPVILWKKLLKNYIGTITANKRKTRTRLNRRQPERYDLSGSMESKVLKIVVAVDTSGSVTDEQISQIFTEIFSIVSGHKHEITVIECDMQIQRVYSIKKKSDLKDSVIGRGGTAFTPVIEYINEHRYFRDALMIYFTDGFGEANIPVPKTYRNLWVIIGDEDNLSVKNPYGRVVSMQF